MSKPYNVGDLMKLTATVANLAGTLVDPTTITFWIRTPRDVFTSQTPSRVSTGVYTFSQTATESGNWEWRAVATGAAQAAGQAPLFVLPTDFPT